MVRLRGNEGLSVYFAVLGPLRVHDGMDEIRVSSPKQRALLAGLLLTAGQTQDADRLIDVVWSGAETGSRRALQMQMVRLRHTIGDRIASRIVTRPCGYVIEVEPGELDVSRFNELCEHGRRAASAGNWVQADKLLGESLALWSGSPLQDVPSEQLHTGYVPLLAEMRLAAVESSIDARLNLGAHDTLVGELRELVRQHPLRERFTAQLMLALHRSGRQADALEVYRTARQYLVAELGIEPGAELQALHQQILGGEGPGDQSAARTAVGGRGASSRPAPAQLPADIRDFTGRTEPVRDLGDLLARRAGADDGAAVTVIAVTGPAGVGKTTLAVHVAHQHRQRFPDGQLYVNLGGAGGQPVSPEGVLGRFLRDLGLDASAVPQEADELAVLYRSVVSDRRLLIVLDNARDGAQVRPLIPAGSGNVILITSRHQLASLDAVRYMNLGVLGSDESRTMFTRIAGHARVAAEPGAVDRVLAVCAGLPLALRIAAARLASQSDRTIEELADRVADTARRLDALHTEDRAVRASFQVSYADLAAAAGRDAMRTFRLLGLWGGPTVSLPAAAALIGRSVRVTEALTETLIEANLLESRSAHRYQLHDLLRIYALERAECEETRADRDMALRRLFSWYLRTADRACSLIEPQRYAPPTPPDDAAMVPLDFRTRQEAISWCDDESANVVAAIRQQDQHGFSDYVWRLASVLAPYYNLRKLWSDWITTHQIGLASASRNSDLLGQARMCNGLGRAHTDLRQFDDAVTFYQRSRNLFRRIGDEPGALRPLINLACLYGTRGQPEAAIAVSREALQLARDLRDVHAEAVALGNQACACMELGRNGEAIRNFQLALAIRQSRHDQYGVGMIHHNLGDLYQRLRCGEESADHLRRALSIRREIGDRYGEAVTLAKFGELRLAQQRRAEARAYLTDALHIFEEIAAPEAAETRGLLRELPGP